VELEVVSMTERRDCHDKGRCGVKGGGALKLET